MSKITKLKVKQGDGTFSEAVDIGAKAVNITTSLTDTGYTNVDEAIKTLKNRKDIKNIMDGSVGGSVRTSGSSIESTDYKIGQNAFAEGYNTKASGYASHAEGSDTTASGSFSHTEGNRTTASGGFSHAEGKFTIASGELSHAEGWYTTASGGNQHVQGKYNIADTTSAHIVGNGATENTKSNAHTIDWSGNAWFQGDVYTGSTSGTNKDSGSKKLESTGNKVIAVTAAATDDQYPSAKAVYTLINAITSSSFQVVTELPTSNISTSTIYLKLNKKAATNNIYDEYIYVNKEWEILGSTAIDLTNYYTKDQVNAELKKKQNTLVSGTNIKTINNTSLLGTGNITIEGNEVIISSTQPANSKLWINPDEEASADTFATVAFTGNYSDLNGIPASTGGSIDTSELENRIAALEAKKTVTSTTITKIEKVTEYPSNQEAGTLYIKVQS